MKVQIMEITPTKAREWLQGNEGNRSIRKTVVARYARDMAAGKWMLNGETIVLNGTRVLDGQHRLLAIIEADVSIQALVVRDAEVEMMSTLDQGVGRTLGDVLRFRGVEHWPNQIAAASRIGWRWDEGVLLQPIHPTIDEALGWLDDHQNTASACVFMNRLAQTPLKIRNSVGTAVYLKAVAAEGESATEFFDRLYDGEHIAYGDSVYALRTALIINAARLSTKMSALQMHAFIVKAWNAWISREPLAQLRWARAAGGREQFPVMRDSAGNPISAEQ